MYGNELTGERRRRQEGMIRFALVSLPRPWKRLWRPVRLDSTIQHLRDSLVFDVVKYFAGSIPTWLTSVGKLRQLWLQSNQLIGERQGPAFDVGGVECATIICGAHARVRLMSWRNRLTSDSVFPFSEQGPSRKFLERLWS